MNIPNSLASYERLRSAPLTVNLNRGSSVESTHRVHAVVSDEKGRVLLNAGQADYLTFIRSALKPFQALPFINSGTAEKIACRDKGIAICCSSHNGSTKHAREAFKILWSSDLNVDLLQCPIPKGCRSPLEHNCSGKHSAFLATCKKMKWPLDNYLDGKHPLQLEIFRRVSELLGQPYEEFIAARDDCGAPTILLNLSQMSVLYAHLSKSSHADLEQISRSMVSHPELISGDGLFDTELMRRSHLQIISKGGAEGIQCMAKVGDGLGIAIKVEDGSKRAKHAVALHILRQLDWITPSALQELEEQILLLSPGVQLEVKGQLKFQQN
ncbi:asparaginase [Prochlorococcus sp. MIT 1307]|uniref:asparaginase n=1 Tax=Prochlorococcus sp. MIT 1307 TaxID=3096219 RepID=UPI002A750B48|nr:asparaginase [Prochlorococcus sp. MIT 1307]